MALSSFLLPQISKGSASFKAVGSSNFTSFKIENEIHTHEDAFRRQLVPHFVRNINMGLKENSFAFGNRLDSNVRLAVSIRLRSQAK